jgi:hypothetical protein
VTQWLAQKPQHQQKKRSAAQKTAPQPRRKLIIVWAVCRGGDPRRDEDWAGNPVDSYHAALGTLDASKMPYRPLSV